MTYAERIAQRDRDDMQTLLKFPWGRRIVHRLLEKTFVFNPVYVQGEFDATAFNEGKRNVGLALFNEVMDIQPEAYMKMIKQEKEDEDARRTDERLNGAAE
jgi:hypothetical protein